VFRVRTKIFFKKDYFEEWLKENEIIRQ